MHVVGWADAGLDGRSTPPLHQNILGVHPPRRPGQGQMDAEDVLEKPSVVKRALIHSRYDTQPPPRGDKPAIEDTRKFSFPISI